MKKIFLAMCLLAFAALHAEDVPRLTLSASATIFKPSDELQMKIGVVTLGDTAEAALAENSSKMNEIMVSLIHAGLEKEDYETSQFSIKPTYTPCPPNPPANWRPRINGYEVTNTMQIHSGKLGMAGKIIDLANRAGANHVSDIRFGLKNAREYWQEALSAAGANAVSDARAIAEATGVQLVRVLSISLANTQVRFPHLDCAAFAKANAATPIEPGEVSLEANVTLVYEIR